MFQSQKYLPILLRSIYYRLVLEFIINKSKKVKVSSRRLFKILSKVLNVSGTLT